jgi:hypothetical protein
MSPTPDQRWSLADPLVRYHAPRDVPITPEERHCPPGCTHLREAHRKGFESGARAERERAEGDRAFGLLFVPVLAALVAGMATAWVWRWWVG